MNSLLIIVIILGAILFVMLCNSSKDQFEPKNYEDSAASKLKELCNIPQGMCGLNYRQCIEYSSYFGRGDVDEFIEKLSNLSGSQKRCLKCFGEFAPKFRDCRDPMCKLHLYDRCNYY